MRIVIDLQGAQTYSQYRGIGRYSMALTLAIAKNRGEHEIWLALNGALPEGRASFISWYTVAHLEEKRGAAEENIDD